MDMETKASPKLLVSEWAKKHWKLLAAFTAGALLVAFAVDRGYQGIRVGGSEYVFLIKKGPIPKSLTLKGTWFFETKTSGEQFVYGNKRCTTLFGKAEINQQEASNEFSIKAVRRLCVLSIPGAANKSSPMENDVNVGWSSDNASVLPDSRRVNITLHTRDTPPRTGYFEGSISEFPKESLPTEFRGDLDYLNTKDQKYSVATMSFCKEGTDCAKDISKKFKME